MMEISHTGFKDNDRDHATDVDPADVSLKTWT